MNFRGFFFLLIAFPAWSQDVDSLLQKVQVAKAHQDTRINLYIDELAKAYMAKSRFDSAHLWYRELLNISKARGIDSLTAISMNDLGVAFYKLEEFDSCIFYYTKALEIYSRINDPLKQAIIELNLSIIYKDRGSYEQAMGFALKSASKLEKLELQPALGSCYNNLGLIYTKLENYPYAVAFHRKALNVRRYLNNQRGVGQSYNNLAVVFRELAMYDSALHYYASSLIVKRLMNDPAGMATTLGNMGDVLFALNKPDEAERHYRESLTLKKSSGDKMGEALTLNSLTRIELLRKNFLKAEEHLNRAEQIETALGFLEGLKDSYSLRVSLFKETGKYDQALLYSEKLIIVKDSLMSHEKARSLAEMQTVYEAEKKEIRIVSLEQERSLQQAKLRANRLWITFLISAAVLLVTIIGLVFYLYRTTRRNKNRVEMLLKELHHRVKNNLQIISSVLSLHSQQLKDVEAVQAVKSSESRVNAMALIHRKLYSGDQDRSINIKDYTHELTNFLVRTYGFHDRTFDLTLTSENILVDVDKAIPVGLILNELISNAFKYAYPEQKRPKLVVTLELVNQKFLMIGIADNGKGMPDLNKQQNSSFGLKMVRMLIDELNGKITVDTQSGTVYGLTIPLV